MIDLKQKLAALQLEKSRIEKEFENANKYQNQLKQNHAQILGQIQLCSELINNTDPVPVEAEKN
tara:strand:- start:1254 stop:1445 length:192 start_codon:yes stop_codon:yes gene_type:complete